MVPRGRTRPLPRGPDFYLAVIDCLRLNRSMITRIITLFAAAILCFGCSKNSGPASATQTVPTPPRSSFNTSVNTPGEFRTTVPSGWSVEKPTSDMRVAQYKLPKADGDSEDALLVVYYFGQGQGGSPQANIDRWINQIKQPDGGSSQERAKTETLKVNGLQVDTVDVSGNYSGGMSPDSAPADSKSIYRLRAAVVETPRGYYFVKLTGPQKTVSQWDQAFKDYLNSFEFK